MSSSKLESLISDLEEINRVSSEVTRQRLKDLLLIESRKIETEITAIKEQLNSISEASQKPLPTQQNKCYNVTITNYAWDQSDKFVKIFVTLKDVQKLQSDKISCTFGKNSMELSIKELENRNYLLGIKNLLEPLDTSKSYWKVKTDTVVVLMAKGKENQHWSHLTSVEKQTKAAPPIDPVDPNEDPSVGIMSILKKMYDDGDDEMKRTIAKAWSEGKKSDIMRTTQ